LTRDEFEHVSNRCDVVAKLINALATSLKGRLGESGHH
jgi:hypothetical protein